MNQRQIVGMLQNLLFSENKAAELRPIDIALLTYLILRQTEDHYIRDSQLTLANRLGCERKAIADSIKRLDGLGWIMSQPQWQWNEKTKRKTRSIGKTVSLSVNLDKLPQAKDRTAHSRPSPEAVALATQHTAYLIGLGKSTRQHKNFDRQQEYAAQRLIEGLGSYDEAADLVSFASDHEQFKDSARKSLYELRTRLSTIKRAYAATQYAAKSGPASSVPD